MLYLLASLSKVGCVGGGEEVIVRNLPPHPPKKGIENQPDFMKISIKVS